MKKKSDEKKRSKKKNYGKNGMLIEENLDYFHTT